MCRVQSGDILLFKGEKGLSWLIAWGTDSPYSHVAICASSKMYLAIEAMAGGGVRARDIRQIKEHYDIFRVRQEYDYDKELTVSYLVSRLNSRYDYFGVLFLGVIKFLAKMGIPLKERANAWQKGRDYFCSELCYEAFYIGGGLDIVPDISEADITSPADIAKSSVLERIGQK